MAATQSEKKRLVGGSGFELVSTKLSSLVSDQIENVAHLGPSGAEAGLVLPVVTVGSTTGDQITCEWIKASDSTANNTVAVRCRVANLGDIAGAEVTVYVYFFNRASAGLNAP